MKEYRGQCHCGAVTFAVKAPKHLVVWDCNCSICAMKKNTHFVVAERDFTLISGKESLTTYTFDTHTAKHMFCGVCGVQSFYKPRSNPNGYGITLSCIIPSSQVESHEVKRFDGQNWEDFYEGEGSAIKKFSE